jgi:hypothetical protein
MSIDMGNRLGDVPCRATCADILQHPWLKQEGVATDKPLDNVVLGRMKKFAAMHKLKKTALMVVGSCLSAEEIAGMKRMFKTIDADGSGTITVKELQVRGLCTCVSPPSHPFGSFTRSSLILLKLIALSNA